jgi:hypothetical protein
MSMEYVNTAEGRNKNKLGAIDDAFNALFFGSGSWLGLLLFLSIMISLVLKWKYIGVLVVPVAVFLGLDYIGYDMSWHAVIMFFTGAFIVVYMMKKGR